MMKEITVIIPFANEGEEVGNTLDSLFKYSNNIDVIIINDASNDNFNYKELSSKYNITYIENKERLGVAASRELGINLCKTKYFLLLDAHMRFYDHRWMPRIIDELNRDSRALLCTQSKVLRMGKDGIEEDIHPFLQLGAYVNFYELFTFLEPKWSIDKKDGLKDKNLTVPIPCVLGAGYACSKKYWQYLKGVEGLLSYGNDEVFISLKVWLEGGTCKLLKDIVIGHLYRDNSPYPHNNINRIYNRLYIAYLLLPCDLKKKAFAIQRLKSSKIYYNSTLLFYKNFDYIENMKKELSEKFEKDFYEIEKFNRSGKLDNDDSPEKKEKLINQHISYIVRNIDNSKGIGLIDGKMGIVILFYHYARLYNNSLISIISDNLLEEIIASLSEETSLSLFHGLAGIGWAIEYLVYNKFIKANTNTILEDFDLKIMSISIGRMINLNLEYGLGGIIRYVLTRLYSNNYRDTSLFSDEFLKEIYLKAKYIIENEIYVDCPETYVEFILFYNNRIKPSPPCIYDVIILPSWNKYSKTNKKISLNGLVGFNLEFILTYNLLKS